MEYDLRLGRRKWSATDIALKTYLLRFFQERRPLIHVVIRPRDCKLPSSIINLLIVTA